MKVAGPIQVWLSALVLFGGGLVLACDASPTTARDGTGSTGSAGAAGRGSAGGTSGQGTAGAAGARGGLSGIGGTGPRPDGAAGTGDGPKGGNAGGDDAAGAGGSAGRPRDASSDPAGPGDHDGGAGQTGTGGGSGGSAHTGVWRIMPLGDSITGTTCVDQLLAQELKDNARTNFMFVGSNLNNQNCSGAPIVQTEGHGGYLVTDLVGNGPHASELPRWCSSDKADVTLMQFGTNDVWNSRPTQSILDAYSTVLTDLRSINPGVILFVAQITPLNPSGCSSCEANVESLNAQIPGWAASKSTPTSPIYVVDLHATFVASQYKPSSTYTADGVHPNPAGSKLIAARWFDALAAKGLP